MPAAAKQYTQEGALAFAGYFARALIGDRDNGPITIGSDQLSKPRRVTPDAIILAPVYGYLRHAKANIGED
jgi:hypothetical protein